METFHKLFGSLLAFVYHCFDRIVIQGYLPLLTRDPGLSGISCVKRLTTPRVGAVGNRVLRVGEDRSQP